MKLTQTNKKKGSKLLPETFALFFMGSPADLPISSQFLRLSSAQRTHPDTFSPMEDESSMKARDYYDFMSFVLDVFNQRLCNVACIIGDNCSTNKALSKRASVPFIGCSIHQFNLTVQLFVYEEPHLEKLNLFMSKLKNLTLGPKLL